MSVRHRLLLPVAAVLLGLTACGSAASPAPVAATPASSAPAPVSPAPTSLTPSKSPAPSKSAAPTATRTAGEKPVGVACPSAKTLEKLTDLPADWHFPASTVTCWKTWATATPEGPNTGDGVYLFHYRSGAWRYHSQGSGYHCKELGIHEAAPFCQYP